ncbi:hypothetical protein LGM31_03355 [Burkholderia vietnamiensis]|nr:hypothetical protein [Burkholderia vietnamiensis]KVS07032.1 hypothetical protein WK29_23225 [Burkholderia vietnamiensis]MCA7982897.1 hypothetical protein [Burkholderia vietnamiensis]
MPSTLLEAHYRVISRERTALAAKAMGHDEVFPQAAMLVKDGWATITRDGVEVWNCSARYAAAHFDLRPA